MLLKVGDVVQLALDLEDGRSRGTTTSTPAAASCRSGLGGGAETSAKGPWLRSLPLRRKTSRFPSAEQLIVEL